VADCVFHAAAAAVISCQTAKRLVISCRDWGALMVDAAHFSGRYLNLKMRILRQVFSAHPSSG
jgi:hypothetical protein